MCGRYALTKQPTDELNRIGITDARDLPLSYNVAPGQHIPVVLHEPERNMRRALRGLEWGLIAPWTKEKAKAHRMINARGETLDSKPSFKGAARHRRCLIPADGFYEWARSSDGTKTPHHIRMKDSRVFFFAGIWESWDGPNEEAIDSCAIITTEPNPLMKRIHTRMPVIMEGDNALKWIDPATQSLKPLSPLLVPFDESEMVAFPVSTRVNSPRNNDPECIAKAG